MPKDGAGGNLAVVHVMVVDDDPFLIDLFEASSGVYEIEVVGRASDGIEALRVYPGLSTRPDIVIMDQRMPNMCGVECTKRLLQMDSSARIVFVSAEHGAKSEALAAGAIAFMEKPFAMRDLMEVLTMMIANKPSPPKINPPKRTRTLKSTSEDRNEMQRDLDVTPPKR
jgi:DNA-binding NarL/FixJ family response regulator